LSSFKHFSQALLPPNLHGVCNSCHIEANRFGEDTAEKNFYHLLANQNAVVAISKGMWTVKLYSNKILVFLSGSAS